MAINPSSFSAAELEKYTDVPALAPPAGVTPDLTARNVRGDVYIGLCSILLGIVFVSLGLRLYAKFHIKRKPGFDDLACIVATIGLSACFGISVLMSMHGVGKHQWNVPLSEIPLILRMGRDVSIILPPTMLSLKLSLLLLYLRVFTPDKISRYFIYFGMCFCAVAYTVLMFLNVFSDVETVIVANKFLGVVNFASDIYILCVPIAAIWKLQLSPKNRLGVMLLFMTGAIACAMSIMGLVFRFQVHRSEADATYLLGSTFIVTTIEEEIGLMCACMPFFPTIISNSSTLQKCIHSVQSVGTWTLKSNRHSSSGTSARRSYLKHVSADSSLEDGLELQRIEASTAAAALPESPKKTPRMEMGAFPEGQQPRSSSAKL